MQYQYLVHDDSEAITANVHGLPSFKAACIARDQDDSTPQAQQSYSAAYQGCYISEVQLFGNQVPVAWKGHASAVTATNMNLFHSRRLILLRLHAVQLSNVLTHLWQGKEHTEASRK
jgi:hypothetical protein